MARFLMVLQPRAPMAPVELVDALAPLLQRIEAHVDHRTPAHLSALLRGGLEQLRMQLFADVQAKAHGPVLEITLMSQEPMGRGAPQTRAVFDQILVEVSGLAPLQLVFRSDRDGPLP